MIIVVSGALDAGKTTACRKLIEIARNHEYACGGIVSYKTPDRDIIIEDIQSGATERLASVNDIYDGPRTQRYCFNPEGIKFGNRAIGRGISAAILVIDEIGHLELRGEGFASVLELIKAGSVKNCILVIRSELLAAFLPRLPDALVFSITTDNHEQLPYEISSVLFKVVENSKSLL
jgi:nucleoside-triphosphatase THEP1